MQHAFYVHFFAVLDDYDVKMPNFALQGKFKTRKGEVLFSPVELGYSPLEFNFRSFCLHLTN